LGFRRIHKVQKFSFVFLANGNFMVFNGDLVATDTVHFFEINGKRFVRSDE
jgi:hypothetical protein